MNFLMWLEQTGFGTFVRESTSIFGYPTFIVMHTVGLAVVVGTSTIVSLRVLGFAESIPLEPLGRLFPLMWGAFILNTFSGSGLAAATATGQFTNPIFIIKILLVITAVVVMSLLQRSVFRNPAIADGAEPGGKDRVLAVGLLGLWLLAMIAGRLIAYAGVVIGR